MEKNNERWAILLFIIVFILALIEFVVLPDGIGLRLFGNVARHYYRLKPLFIVFPVIVGSAGAAMVHHGTVRKGMIVFIVGMALFAVNLILRL